MPLEKIALCVNSSAVSGSGQFAQAVRITFREGPLAPYRCVGAASVVAWFLQYSTMTLVFQFCDHGLAAATNTPPVAAKDLAAAAAAGIVESAVSNRAEAQRFFGLDKFAKVEAAGTASALRRAVGPAFVANVSRNSAMCYSAFVATPILYSLLPQETKDRPGSFFYFALGVNMFAGNGLAVTQQCLWGRAAPRALEYHAAAHPPRAISYRDVVAQALQTDGPAAFFTPSKWFARVLMNAPAEGTLAWFYNRVLPLGERTCLDSARAVYERRPAFAR
ncbi:hypothetical protein M885DRAFT_490349 [Pelagophyceae sp. CCMP2097]|nr:hypothetical protein M885DRAFT_490349 [Pelagophyceae sp. CCMP2097]